MGNQLTVEKIIENIHKFKPDLGVYELVNNNSFQQDRMINKWQHKFTSQRLIQKKYLVRTWLQFYDLLENFSFRYNNDSVVASKYLLVQNSQSIKKLINQKVFPDTSVSIFYQDTLTNLSHFKQIPQQDGAYFLLQSLKGFGSLVKKIKFPFQIKQQMFHITANKQLKIWVDENISDLSVMNKLKPLPSQSYMIHKVLETIKANIYFTTQSKQVIPIQNIYMPPIIIEELLKRKYQNFQQAIQMTQKYLDHYEIKIGSFMSCLKDLTNEELINFMDQSKRNTVVPHYATSTNQNSRVIVNNTSSQISMKPFTPINQFSNQSSIMQLQRNYSMGNLSNYQQNNQSRINDSKVHATVKNSRSKSNKKSGISLVKKQQKNYQSSIVIKQQRPSTSFINSNQSPLKIQPQSSKLPPRSSSAKKVQFTLSQQKENITPFNQNSKKLQLSSHHNRGISITKKQQSRQKSPMIKLNPQSPFSRANNHFNTQISNTINCSTVSVGPLPTPKYRNDSKAKTTFNAHNMSINFSTMSPSETFVPNQSLTRFQKENITYNNPGSLNGSVNHYNEMPRIYVHSPKAQGKILRLDSMSTQEESGQKPITHYQPSIINNANFTTKKQQDRIKEYQQQPSSQVFYYTKNSSKKNVRFQTPQNTNKKTSEFDSYIEENNEVFTHPRLYEYITNNKSDNTVKQQTKSPFKRTQEKKSTYIDYLANAQISQSLDYHTADKIFSLKEKKQIKEPVKKAEIISPHNNFSLNDFPTIEEIQQPPHSNDSNQKQENGSFLPVQLNLMSNMNLGSRNQLSTVRRGQQQSLVVEYKKFYDDTNRSNNSPNKHYFSPLKKKPTIQLINPSNFESNMAKKYSTAQNWQASPPKPVKVQTTFNNYLFPIQQNPRPPMIVVSKESTQQLRRNSPSPVSKIIYNGTKQPAINPLILQDMQRIRQNRIC